MPQTNPPKKKKNDYFEGYIAERVPRKNGRGYKTVRTYVGEIHRLCLPVSARRWRKALFAGLFLVALGLLVSSAGEYRPSNTSWFVAVAQVACFLCFAWVLLAFVIYMPTGPDFTLGEWRGGPLALRKSSLGAAIALAATGLFTLIHLLTNLGGGQILAEAWGIVRYLLAAAAMLAVNRAETRLPYDTIPGKNDQETEE